MDIRYVNTLNPIILIHIYPYIHTYTAGTHTDGHTACAYKYSNHIIHTHTAGTHTRMDIRCVNVNTNTLITNTVDGIPVEK